MPLEIPPNIKVLHLENSILWFSPDGIVYSKSTGDQKEQTNEDIHREMAMLREFLGNKKICLVSESGTSGKPPKKEQRDLIASEISSITKAMALIVTSPVSRMLANLFFSFKPPTYPVKMFATEKEATEWIRQYL